MTFQPATEWQPNATGAFLDLPSDTYHAAPGVSQSMLKNIEPTPAHLVHYLTKPREVSAEMIMGTLCHSRVLEPSSPLPRIAIRPDKYPAPADCSAVKQKKAQPGDLLDWHGSATYCKEWVKQQEAADNIVLTEADFAAVDRMVRGVTEHPAARAILTGARTEVSLFRDQGGLLRKHRLDIVPEGNFLADIKTTDDASPEAFSKNLESKGWATQAADYCDAWNQLFPNDPRNLFAYIVVERETGFVAVYYLKPRAMEFGRIVNARRVNIARECYAMNSFPAYPEEMQEGDIREFTAKGVGL